MVIVGVVTSLILLGIALLHVYWTFSGTRLGAAVIPTRDDQPLFRPTPLTTLAVAAALLASVLLVWGAPGFIPLPAWLPAGLFKLGVWGVAAVLALRAIGDCRYVGFFKRVRNTPFAQRDTWGYSPLCMLLALGCVTVAL